MPAIAALFDRLREHRFAPLLALILGALTPLSLAPFHYWPVALLTIGLFSELLRDQPIRKAVWRGFLFGFGLWAYGASWLYVSIHDYGDTSIWLAVPMVGVVAAVMGLFFALMGALYERLSFRGFHLLPFAALYVLCEWLRSWLFTGFPWLFTGYAFTDTPLAGYAPLLGIFGVSTAAIMSAQGLFTVLREGRRAWKIALGVIALWLGGFGLYQVQWTQVDHEALTVSIVQGNIPQESKWALEWRDKTINIYRDLSKNEWGRDIVIWPEAALPMFYHEATDVLEEMQNHALTGHTAFVTGIPYAQLAPNQHDVEYYNSIIALGEGNGLYNKQRLVPFGEYVPMESLLRGLMPFFDLPMSGFNWGKPDQMPLLVKDHLMAPYICYEIAYPDLVRRAAGHADILSTISNDGWFGGSIGPYQHFQMVQMRALETGRQIIRATNNGISAIIDEKGRVVARAPQFQRLVLRGEIHPTHGDTPYVAFGNIPVLALCAVLLLISILPRRQKR